MNKFFGKIGRVLAVGVLVCGLTVAFAACGDDNGGGGDGDKTITYSTSTLAEGTVGTAYSASVATATGATGITYAVATGSLPAGLTLSTAGAISGTPTAEGTANFSVKASATGAKDATASFSIKVNAASGGGNGSGSATTYTLEIEDVDFTGLRGAGISGSGEETELILPNSNASNKYYVGMTHVDGLTFTFNFTASKAGKANLVMALGNESGTPLPLKPENLIIKVNNMSVTYDAGSLPGLSGSRLTFADYTVGEIDLVEGDNVITLTIGTNKLMNGGSMGPMIDCLKLTTEATIVFTPVEGNY